MIYAKEERNVAVIDIKNDVIQTRIEHEKYMSIITIRRILVDMPLDIVSDVYGLYVTTDRKGINQLITQCMNAINGTILVSLMYYCKFCKMLKWNKFKMNPYDPCVANILVNGLQQYILFHVDNCKLGHKDTMVNDSFIG